MMANKLPDWSIKELDGVAAEKIVMDGGKSIGSRKMYGGLGYCFSSSNFGPAIFGGPAPSRNCPQDRKWRRAYLEAGAPTADVRSVRWPWSTKFDWPGPIWKFWPSCERALLPYRPARQKCHRDVNSPAASFLFLSLHVKFKPAKVNSSQGLTSHISTPSVLKYMTLFIFFLRLTILFFYKYLYK